MSGTQKWMSRKTAVHQGPLSFADAAPWRGCIPGNYTSLATVKSRIFELLLRGPAEIGYVSTLMGHWLI